jgi:formate hydrogenlyase transcriptional activator
VVTISVRQLAAQQTGKSILSCRSKGQRSAKSTFVDRYTSKAGKNITGINKESMALQPLASNIRELLNVIERSVITSDQENLSVDESSLGVCTCGRYTAGERNYRSGRRERKGRVSGSRGAAARLVIPQSTLDSKIKALKIDEQRFRRI